MRYRKAKIALVFWCLFVGVGALIGSFWVYFDVMDYYSVYNISFKCIID